MYKVYITDRENKQHEKTFNRYRDAVCYATNYRKVKQSMILKDDQIILNQYKF